MMTPIEKKSLQACSAEKTPCNRRDNDKRCKFRVTLNEVERLGSIIDIRENENFNVAY